MARIIIAGAAEERRTQVARLLASSGFTVFRCVGDGGELRRCINECQDGIVILLGELPECQADDLYWDYGERIRILLVARPPVLEKSERPEVFRLAMPVSGQARLGAVNVLEQMHQMHMPRRTGADRDAVEQAKAWLMRTRGISEPEAHRMLQKHAMGHGLRMADEARRILKERAELEE